MSDAVCLVTGTISSLAGGGGEEGRQNTTTAHLPIMESYFDVHEILVLNHLTFVNY